jgi:hypothetical protein
VFTSNRLLQNLQTVSTSLMWSGAGGVSSNTATNTSCMQRIGTETFFRIFTLHLVHLELKMWVLAVA